MNLEQTNPAAVKRLADSELRLVERGLLRSWPLPEIPANGGKDARGSVLVVGGSAEIPGAVVFSAVAALRAGAGRLSVATAASVAALVAQAVPEARVVALEERDGVIQPEAAEKLNSLMGSADAALLGPGMQGRDAVRELLERLDLSRCPIVLDAEAVPALGEMPRSSAVVARGILTPHAGEMAGFLHVPRSGVEATPLDFCREAASRSGATVVLKGAESWIADPDGSVWLSRAGNSGLGTSGSGDVLAGLIVGLLARGATRAQAAVWGTFTHGRAGEVLATRIAPVGYLARELLDVIPGLLAKP